MMLSATSNDKDLETSISLESYTEGSGVDYLIFRKHEVISGIFSVHNYCQLVWSCLDLLGLGYKDLANARHLFACGQAHFLCKLMNYFDELESPILLSIVSMLDHRWSTTFFNET
jgi:hypothetical protein